mgnify:CR=1 FL=1
MQMHLSDAHAVMMTASRFDYAASICAASRQFPFPHTTSRLPVQRNQFFKACRCSMQPVCPASLPGMDV